MSRMSKAVVLSAGVVIAVLAALLWGGFIVVERVRGASAAETPAPPPPSDRIEGAPAPDNTIKASRAVGSGS